MSDHAPTPPIGTGSSTWSGYDPPEPQRPSRGAGRGTKVLVITAALVLVIVGGVFALFRADPFNLFRAGPQAAEGLPSGALFYFAVDLDPSATQKVNALRFLNHFPAFKDETGIESETADVREKALSDALESAGCDGLSYSDDIKPWLGNKFGFAGMAADSEGDDPVPVGAIEVTNQGEAEAGLDKLAACGGETTGTEFGYAFTGEYALIAETQDLADTYAADTDEASLADSADFQADMDSLGDLGVATMWVDTRSVFDTFESQIASSSSGLDGELDVLKSAYQRAAATFRFEPDRFEVVATVYGDTPVTTHSGNQIVDLPDSTTFAASEAGGGNRLDASWERLLETAKSRGVDVEQQIADFEAETGLSLPDDLATILGDNLLLSVDSEGLTSDNIQNFDLASIPAGARFTGDPDKLNDLYDRILDLVASQFRDPTLSQDPPFTKLDAEDGIVVATNDSYGETLKEMDGTLGDSEQFKSVTEAAAGKEVVFYFDCDSVQEQILEVARNDGASEDDLANITPLRAFGLTSETEGNYTVVTTQVSVND